MAFSRELAVRLVIGLALLTGACSSDDGVQEVEPVAQVAQAVTVSPPLNQFVVLARHGATIADRTTISGGHVGITAGSAPPLNTYSAGFNSRTAIGRETIAPRVVLAPQAVSGNLNATVVSATGATTGTRSPFIAPPATPTPSTATPGTANITVNTGQTLPLAAGRYAAVSVNGILNLSGGLYEFQSLLINNDARVVALAPSSIRIVTGLTARDRVRLVAQSNNAADLVVQASGTVDSTNGLLFGNDPTITALLVAQRGVRAGDRAIASGAVAGQDVVLGHDGRLQFSSGFACNSDASCGDGNACTIETCADVKCSAAPSSAAECQTSILAATETDGGLSAGPFNVYNPSIEFRGRITVPVGLTSATLSLNGATPITPTLDAGGNFSVPLSLLSDATRIAVTNIVQIVVTDVFGRVTIARFVIEVLSVAVPNETVVLFNPDTTDAVRHTTLAAAGASFLRALTPHIWLVSAPSGASALITALAPPSPTVRSAFPNVVLKQSLVPNDALIDTQIEYLTAVNAFSAWDIEQGSNDVLVAVVDSGMLSTLLISDANPACSNYPGANNLYLNESECCATSTCTQYERENCFPGASNNPNSEFGTGTGDCPRKDQNNDGCPGTCGVDDDNDGAADMADPELKRLYSNGYDDDGDGHIDEQAIVGGTTKDCASVSAGELVDAPVNGDCDGAANDDDENGYPDDCRGWAFGRVFLPECADDQEATANNGTCLVNASTRHPNETFDVYGFRVGGAAHGQQVGRIIGEPGNNCGAYAGMAFHTRVVPLVNARYVPPTGMDGGKLLPDIAATVEAFQYAGKLGAHIINSSFEGGPDEAFAAQFPELANSYGVQLVTDLMDLTGTSSALHVLAAGNSKSNITGWVTFPSAANIPNKVVVGASNPGAGGDAPSSFTNFSATIVDLAAPGERLLGGFSGTSGATPIVSGAAALLLSHFPSLRGQPELAAQMIRDSTRAVAAWSGKSKTGGVLDVAAALGQAVPSLLYSDVSATGIPSPGSHPTTELDLVDTNYDGKFDLMIEAQCTRTNVVGQPHLRVNESGTLVDHTVDRLPVFEGSFCDIVDGDLDGDGHVDLVLTAYAPDGTTDQKKNQVLMGSATAFSLSDRLPADDLITRAASLCDFDSDGDLDVLLASTGTTLPGVPTLLLQNDGAGNFTDVSSSTIPSNPLRSQSPHHVLCADLDTPPPNLCDGLAADVCQLCANPRISVQGLVSSGRITSTLQAACSATRALVKPEFVIAASEGTSTTLLRRNGSGVFEDHSCDLGLPFDNGTPFPGCVDGSNTPGRQDQDVDAADFDQDGDLDLVFISRRGRPNTLLFNNGSGVFTNVTASNWTLVVDDARALDVADVDNDGDTDLLVLRGDPNLMNQGQNTLYLNNGSGILGEFAASGLGSTVDLTTEGRFGDADGDGDQDIVLVRYGKADRLLSNNTVP